MYIIEPADPDDPRKYEIPDSRLALSGQTIEVYKETGVLVALFPSDKFLAYFYEKTDSPCP